MSYPIAIERPKNLAAASKRLAALQGKGAIIGGGLEILDQLRLGDSSAPDVLISLKQIGETSFIKIHGPEVHIGASTTIAEIAESSGIRRVAWPLMEAAAAVGSPQIRAQGTIAGNLLQRNRCWYLRNGFSCARSGGEGCPAKTGDNRYHALFAGGPTWSVFQSDIALALYVLQARLVIVSPEGERNISISDLYMDPKIDPTREHTLKPGEIIREIRIAALTNRFVSTFMKVRERNAFDFSIVSVALIYNNFHGRFKNMQIYLGGVAPLPYVPQKTIDALLYKKLTRDIIAPAAELAAAGAEPLAHNAYKIPIIKSLVRDALLKTYEYLSWKPD